MASLRASAIVIVAGLAGAAIGCKSDEPKPAKQRPARTADRMQPAQPPRPAPPADGSAAAAEIAFPPIRDARVITPPRATPDLDAQLTAWCLAGPIDAAVQQLTASLTAGGFDHVAARGTGARRAISGVRGEDRISISVGGVDQRCDGIVATGTIVRARHVAPPPLEPGERIR